MSLDSNALITLDDLKTYLKESENQDDYDQIFEMLINSASTLMQKEMGRELVYQTYTAQKLSGRGLSQLWLPAWPIVSITSLTESGLSLTENTDYIAFGSEREGGYLVKLLGGLTDDNDLVWIKGIKNITITYKAGYWVETDPADGTLPMLKDIQQACRQQVGFWWKESDKEDWGETSRSFPDGSSAKVISALESGLLKSVIDICANYRRKSII